MAIFSLLTARMRREPNGRTSLRILYLNIFPRWRFLLVLDVVEKLSEWLKLLEWLYKVSFAI
jgi:hypothetical protein